MRIDPGMAVVIGAVLIFYLRLIILQRERAKQVKQAELAWAKTKKGKSKPAPPESGFSVFSPNRRDQAIGAAGLLIMVLGLLVNAGKLPFPAIQPYWWIPTALGIVAFSFAFKL